MRSLLRHPPLAFWTATVTVLAALLVVSLFGRGESPLSPAPPAKGADRAAIMQIVEQGASMNPVTAGVAGNVSSWASGYAASVQAAKELHDRTGQGDQVSLAYGEVVAKAEALANVDTTDADAVLRAKTELSLAVFALASAGA